MSERGGSAATNGGTNEEVRADRETAVLGGGCFWCTEAVFSELRGVERVLPGYAGGSVAHPTYEQVCSGTTGHAEVVEVIFDPAHVSFPDLLRVFFTIHDPTTKDRQGHDVGTQYRSIILYRDARQHEEAVRTMREIGAEKMWHGKLVTEVVPLTTFYPAEEYHRDYFRRNPTSGYCQAVIEPKVAKFRRAFLERLQPT
ncbi:MAG: peptide-methionine (S)-S-oxide reductase MsrA [Thermoplasmata archaeon]